MSASILPSRRNRIRRNQTLRPFECRRIMSRLPASSNLGPTLSPEKFTGMTRDAYKAAQEIPQTLAQMPCYCHCDRSLGHKSLHSCFEDDHAAHCAVCAGEALMAYRLQKEQKLSVPQIRERIIAEYQTL